MKNLFVTLTVTLFLLLGNAGSSYSLTIDFTDAAWEAAEGFDNFTLGDITLQSHPFNSTLWHDPIDGIGVIYSYENDEIEDNELLQVSFASLILLDVIHLADFFYECRQTCYSETGSYSLDGGVTWISISAPNPSFPNGEMSIAIGQLTDSIWFMAPGQIGLEDHEYALQALTYTDLPPQQVPEPTTLILYGIGIVAICPWLRRRNHLKN